MSKRAAIWILIGVAAVFAVVGFQRLHRTNMIEVIGVYPVTADEPCHLVEFRARDVQAVFDFGSFTQEMPDTPRSNWQAPWMERILSTDGTKVVADDSDISQKPELFRGDVRCVFFFHYLDAGRPLLTPFGEVRLPKPADRPERLSMIQYEAP